MKMPQRSKIPKKAIYDAVLTLKYAPKGLGMSKTILLSRSQYSANIFYVKNLSK